MSINKSGGMTNYSHKPIDLDRTAIRQLRLLKGYRTDPIRCELFQSFLDDTHVPYEALSYTWGDDDDKKHIEIDGRPFPVRNNLHMALRHLRCSETDRILWVDAVCIDQASKRERNHQVGQMDRVYRTAERVLVWLGPGNQGIDALMEMTRALDRRVSHPEQASLDDWRAAWADLFRERGGTASALHDARIQALTDLLRRPWFSRIWVVQEVALARHANLVCGWSWAPARAFALMPALLGVDVGPHISPLLDVMPGPLRHSSWWARRRDLLTMLQKFGRRAATDPRDRIYALFGIASDMSITQAIKPRYGEDVSEAVVDVMCFLLFGDVSSASKLEFPKWTVDELLATLEGDNVDTLVRRLLEWSLSTDAHTLTEKLLGREKLDVNSPRVGEAGQPVLHYLASRPPHPKYILFLKTIVDRQDLDVDVNLRAPAEPPRALGLERSTTPLAVALEYGNTEAVKILLRHRSVDVTCIDSSGESALTLAVQHNRTEILKLLLSRHPCPASTVALALSEAVKHQADAAAEILIAQGADINGERQYRTNPLKEAIRQDNSKMVSLMLNHKPDAIDARFEDGRPSGTPLRVATVLGKLNAARILIDMGANIEIPSEGETPLYTAACCGHTEIVNILLKSGANIEAGTADGLTPLRGASIGGSAAVVQALIRGGADIETKDSLGRTPLWNASSRGYGAVVEALIRGGADIEAKDSLGRTPLWNASSQGYDAVVEALIRGGADIEAKDFKTHGTPLWVAAYKDWAGAVKLLLNAGADLTAKGREDEPTPLTLTTPREIASAKGHERVLRILPSEA